MVCEERHRDRAAVSPALYLLMRFLIYAGQEVMFIALLTQLKVLVSLFI